MTIYWKIFYALEWVWVMVVFYHAFIKQNKTAQPPDDEEATK